MLRTSICNLCKIDLPIVQAGMGGVATAPLAAAVSEAGGLGTVALGGLSPDAAQAELAKARSLTRKPLCANVLLPFLQPGTYELIARERIESAVLFWGDPAEHIPAAKKCGLTVIWQCGSAEDATRAKRAGADAIMAQGFEAGGHVEGIVTTLALLPEVRDAIGDMPMVAAGGFADGRGLAASFALGADGAVFGTRFIASRECAAHPDYKHRLLTAHASETIHTTLYDRGWPNAPHRVLRTALVEEWERAGRPKPDHRPGEGVSRATLKVAGGSFPLPNYSVAPPSDVMEGDLGGLAWYAGESVSLVHEILPAGEIVRKIAAEAEATLNRINQYARR